MNFFEKYVIFILKHKVIIITLLFILILFSILGIKRLEIISDFDIFMPKDSIYYQNQLKMNSTFGSGEQMILIVEFDGDMKNLEGLKFLRELQKNIENMDEVFMVTGPAPEKIFQGLRIIEIENIEERDVIPILNFIDSMDLMNALTVKDKKTYAQFTIVGKNDVSLTNFVKNLEIYLQEEKLVYYIAGNEYLQIKLFDYIIQILYSVPTLAVLIMFLSFRYRMKSTRITLLSVIPAVLAAIFTLGIIGWISGKLSIITVTIPVFVTVLGSAGGLHFMTHYVEYLQKKQKKEALIETLKTVGTPLIMTVLTTITGFLSMTIINSYPIKEMGVYAAIGIFMSGFSTIVFLPLFCYFTKKINYRLYEKKSRTAFFLRKTHGNFSIIIALIIFIFFIPGILLLQTNFNLLSLYKSNTDIKKNIEKIQEINKGAIPVFINYSSEEDLLSHDFAKKIMHIQNEIENRDLITSSISFYDLLSTVNKMAYNLENAQYPTNTFIARILFSLIYGNIEATENFILLEEGTGRFAVFPKDFSSKTLNEIESLINSYSPDNTQLNIVGIPFLMHEMNNQIIPEQLKSIILAAILVFFMILITQKSIKIAFFSIIPITITLVALFGMMGYTGIDLSIITSMMASLTIGVGIDYAIHFSGIYRFFKLKKDKEPVQKAFYYVSTPIIANSLGLALGFTALCMSPFTFHNHISLLMWTTMVVSSYLSLTLLPTLIQKFEK